jgi:hypothetical protein
MGLRATGLFLLTLLVLGFNNLPTKALEPNETTSEKYLLDHGHSAEIVRMINLQKERAEGIPPRSKSESHIKKFFKNLWYEQDATMPATDFGYNKVKTVETDKFTLPVKNFLPKKIDKKEDIKNNENTKPENL